ncbi:hypothetical protein IW261DRAFT_1572091 [Armillaria novae-zelandiae]|uniref:Protein kinase domain-containing protein n=1 Tax=Armillaria novae-zelandiae TaxID=153914 RepID=A0AA39U079_9AGAR|nr:hypothetical protein IW261DRAFT_1572091 [Armillaria novae-zelandiae]
MPRDPYGQVFQNLPPEGILTPNNIPWGHIIDDFYWIRRLPDSDNFGDAPSQLVDEMCNGAHSLKPRLFDAVKDAHPFACFESSEKRVELFVEPALANSDIAASIGESVVEGAVKLGDKHSQLMDTEVKDDDTRVQKKKGQRHTESANGRKGVLSAPPLLMGVINTENDAFKGDQSLFLFLTKGDLTGEVAASVENCNFEENSHHLPAGFTENNDKGDEIDTPEGFVLTDDNMTGGSGEGYDIEVNVGDGQLCTGLRFTFIGSDRDLTIWEEDGVPPSAEIVIFVEEFNVGNYTVPMDGKIGARRKPATLLNDDLDYPVAFHLTPTKEERYAASASRRITTLNLSGAPRLGEGSDPCVSVATKLASIKCTDRKLLEKERRICDAFPKHLEESYCGYNLVDPMDHPVSVGACTPKFFGYYVRVQEGTESARRRKALKSIKEQSPPPRAKEARSPIILLKGYRTPIEPEQFSEDERSECFALVLHLHHADLVQNSLYTRNILQQPGPLSARPSDPSLKTPNFRIIDFGRGAFGPWYIERNLGEEDSLRSANRSDGRRNAPAQRGGNGYDSRKGDGDWLG